MESQQGKKKFERTSLEQLQYYIAYVKQHPELLAGKNTPAQPRQMQIMWEVARNLNALRGPTRAPVKWKESLANWKKQLRSRARRLKAEQMRTRGGPKLADLGDFDSQALDAPGITTVHGIPAQVLGFEDIVCSAACEDVPALDVTVDEPFSPPLNNTFQSSDILTISPTNATPSRVKNKRGASRELVDVVLKHKRKREEHDERMLVQQKRNNDALEKLGEGLLALAAALKKD